MVEYKDNLLIINNIEIKVEYEIKQILVLGKTIVILIDNEEMTNNIIAYNEQGVKLWEINDILQIEQIGNFTEIEKVSDNVLGAYYVWGIYFEIDVEKRKELSKEYVR